MSQKQTVRFVAEVGALANQAIRYLVPVVLIFVAAHHLVIHIHMGRIAEAGADGIYIWGDSRTYRGIDGARIAAGTGRPVVNLSYNGAGIYDFAVIARAIPDNATAILGFSLAMPIRYARFQLNRDGIYLPAVYSLWRNGVAPGDIWQILRVNRDWIYGPSVTDSTPPFPDYETIQEKPEQWDKYRYFFRPMVIPDYFHAQYGVMVEGLALLEKKGVDVRIVEIPGGERIRRVRAASGFRDYSARLRELASEQVQVHSGFVLESDDNIYFDFTHLNNRGRQLLTDWMLREVVDDLVVNPVTTQTVPGLVIRDAVGSFGRGTAP